MAVRIEVLDDGMIEVEFPAFDCEEDLKRFKKELKAAFGRSHRQNHQLVYFPALGW